MINITQEQVMQNWGVENTETPLVSIRCITYNQESYIAQALDGFLMQKTTFPFEVIVHDDASTDKTSIIIREYESKFPKIIKPIYETENLYSKHDGSLGRIVNDACKGKYIAICEGDDYWIDSNKLQLQVDFLETHKNYSMCFHKAEIKKEIDIDCGLKCETIEDRDYTATEVFKEWIVPTASICVKKDVFFIPIKHEERMLNGDIFLVERAAHCGKIRGFSNVMSVYRLQKNGVTYDKNLSKKRILAYPDHYKTISENFPKIRKYYIHKFLIYSYIGIYRHVDKKPRILLKAFFVSPCIFISMLLKKLIFR